MTSGFLADTVPELTSQAQAAGAAADNPTPTQLRIGAHVMSSYRTLAMSRAGRAFRFGRAGVAGMVGGPPPMSSTFTAWVVMQTLSPYTVHFSPRRRRTVATEVTVKNHLTTQQRRLIEQLPVAMRSQEDWELLIDSVLRNFEGFGDDKNLSCRVHCEFVGDACRPLVDVTVAWTGLSTVNAMHSVLEALLSHFHDNVSFTYVRTPCEEELRSIVAEIAAQLDMGGFVPNRTRSECLAFLRDDGFRVRVFEWLERNLRCLDEETAPDFPGIPVGDAAAQQRYIESTGMHAG